MNLTPEQGVLLDNARTAQTELRTTEVTIDQELAAVKRERLSALTIRRDIAFFVANSARVPISQLGGVAYGSKDHKTLKAIVVNGSRYATPATVPSSEPAPDPRIAELNAMFSGRADQPDESIMFTYTDPETALSIPVKFSDAKGFDTLNTEDWNTDIAFTRHLKAAREWLGKTVN